MNFEKKEFQPVSFPGEDISYVYVDHAALKELTFLLSQKVIDGGEEIDRMVILSKGGWVPGRIFFDYLRVIGLENTNTIGVKSISGVNKRKRPVIYQKLPGNVEAELQGEKVLIVEELSDTGEQLKVVSQYLRDLGVEKVVLASLFRKPQSKAELNYWAAETASWLIFAYEAIETMGELYLDWSRKEGQSGGIANEQIRQRFEQIGFETMDIEYFWANKKQVIEQIIKHRKLEAEEAEKQALQMPLTEAMMEL